jgi:hypothetical protein
LAVERKGVGADRGDHAATLRSTTDPEFLVDLSGKSVVSSQTRAKMWGRKRRRRKMNRIGGGRVT